MVPMISTLEEMQRTRQIIEECKEELLKDHIPHSKHIQVGALVEVPSAALMIDEICAVSDFISIGTNDLIQYIMAVDRGNDAVSRLYQEFHPAVLRTLKHIIDACSANKKPVTMCGEMAADNLAMPLLVGMGLQSISVSPAALYSVKRTIRAILYEKAQKLAVECLQKSDHEQVTEEIKKFFEEYNIPRTRTILNME
jgi:phosphotransferase system enzyme I (PtsI)